MGVRKKEREERLEGQRGRRKEGKEERGEGGKRGQDRKKTTYLVHNIEEGQSGENDEDKKGSDDAGNDAIGAGRPERGGVDVGVVDVDRHNHIGGSSVIFRQTTVVT